MILKIADASDQLHITLQSTHYKRSCFVIQKLSNQKLSINISCGYNLAATIIEPSIYSCHPGNTLYNTYCCINISIIDFILRAFNKIKIVFRESQTPNGRRDHVFKLSTFCQICNHNQTLSVSLDDGTDTLPEQPVFENYNVALTG